MENQINNKINSIKNNNHYNNNNRCNKKILK